MARKTLAPKFPCIVPTCPAMVQVEGRRCSVHRTWTNGPYDVPCVKCRQPIVFGDLWRPVDGDRLRPVHSQCVGGRARENKKQPRGWDANLGALIAPEGESDEDGNRHS